jgi:DNA-binding MarR family transcriptional regulator
MIRRELVEWSEPEHDRRTMWIVASTEGKRRYEQLRRSIVRENARLLASYSPAARRSAIDILRQLAERAGGTATAASTRQRGTTKPVSRRPLTRPRQK